MKTEPYARIHRFNDNVALSFPSTPQLYLTPKQANQLANELKRFAKNAENKESKWITTRIVNENGKAYTESTKKSTITYI